MIGFLSNISKINCTSLPCLFFLISFRCCWVKFPRHYRSYLFSPRNISRLGLCLVRIELKLSQAHIHWFEILCELQVSQDYLTSQHLSAWTVCVGYTSNERVIVLLLSVISRQHRYKNRTIVPVRIGCHNNFVKAMDGFSRVWGRFWNMMLLMFYLNVFHLPTFKDVVGH